MNASKYTFDYLKSLNAVLVETKIVIQNSFIGDTISVNKREYYKKRNGKICYVDYQKKYFKPDWNRIKTYRNSSTTSTGENDWRPLHMSNTTYRLTKEYREELINQFLNQV